MNTEAAAKKYRKIGLTVLPFPKITPIDRPGRKPKKEVKMPKNWTKMTSDEAEELQAEDGQCLAIRAGPSKAGHVIILDLDEYEPSKVKQFQELMNDKYDIEPFSQSPNGGLHYMFLSCDPEAWGDTKNVDGNSQPTTIDGELFKLDVFIHSNHMITVPPSSYTFKGQLYEYKS
ncbi:MAG: hypothetical protein ACRC1D_00765, partial [Culicoidibacterales bacterium]